MVERQREEWREKNFILLPEWLAFRILLKQ